MIPEDPAQFAAFVRGETDDPGVVRAVRGGIQFPNYRELVRKCIDYVRHEEGRGFAGPDDNPSGLFTPTEWAELQRLGQDVPPRDEL